MLWENLREEEFEDAIERSGGVCVMVLGCLEKHGQHLPVGTDSLKGDAIVKLAAEKADVMVFPTTMWLGDVSGARTFKNPTKSHGFIDIKIETLLDLLEQLCDEIARNGFRKILLCSSHGGNVAMLSLFVRKILQGNKNYIVSWARAYDFAEIDPKNMLETARRSPEYFSMLTDEDYKTLEKFAECGTGGGHGDFRETALMMGTYPHLVAPERFDAEDGSSIHRVDLSSKGIMTLLEWNANFPNSYSGFAPFGCSKTIGDAAVKRSVYRLADILCAYKNDTATLAYKQEALEAAQSHGEK